MSKHTPGPWEWDSNPCNYDPHNEAPWLWQAPWNARESAPILSGSIKCGNEADARLIAAAPDLLEALQKFVAWSEAERNHEGTSFWQRVEMLRELDDAADAAIAKATGGRT